MSSTPPVAPDIDIHASKAPQFYAAAITSYVLAVAAVALRLWSRKLMKTALWVDDWVIALALLIATGFFADAISWLRQGFGHHYEVLPGDFLTTFGKNLFTEEILYLIVIGLVKFSMLAFYWRLFKASIRTPCYILGALTTCWEIASILVTVFQCIPVSALWNGKLLSNCLNNKHLFIGTTVPKIATDLALLALPVPYIWRLHTTASQKIALTGTFMLGGFVTVISIARLTILFPKVDLRSWDLDYDFVNFGSWSIAESNMTIVAACLPSLGPILSLILYREPDPSVRRSRGAPFGRSWTRNQASVVSQTHGQPTSATESRQKFVPLFDEACGFSGVEQLHGIASIGSDERKSHKDEDIEMQTRSPLANQRIEVRTDVTVQLTQL